jgi:hypothetical protein
MVVRRSHHSPSKENLASRAGANPLRPQHEKGDFGSVGEGAATGVPREGLGAPLTHLIADSRTVEQFAG